MDRIALLAHVSPTAVVAYRSGLAVTARQFLLEAEHVAERLPNARHVLNVCADRYQFTVGLAACLMSQRISLLPSTHTPQVIAQLADFAPDAFCLTDDARCEIELPQVFYPDLFAGGAKADRAAPAEAPQTPVQQLAAIVFTSGSTGTPVPYRK